MVVQGWRLGREVASEVIVAALRRNFELPFEGGQPALHQVDLVKVRVGGRVGGRVGVRVGGRVGVRVRIGLGVGFVLHAVHVLEEDPAALLGEAVEAGLRIGLLPLAHRDGHVPGKG